jgi:predicted O-methyltransferase YrrM
MNQPLDTRMLQELNGRKNAFPIDDDLLLRQTASSPDPDVLRFIGMLVLWQQPRHIFVFGCGPGVVFLSRLQERLAAQSGITLMTIDHSQRCIGETRRALGGSSGVHLVHAPLAVTECAGRVFTTYHPWYTREIPGDVRFDFVFIDGPPAFRYGREATLYHLERHLSSEALIILDDANTEHGQEALANWQRAWPDRFEAMQFPEVGKGLAVLRIGAPVTEEAGLAVGTPGSADLDRVITFLKAEGGVVADGR